MKLKTWNLISHLFQDTSFQHLDKMKYFTIFAILNFAASVSCYDVKEILKELVYMKSQQVIK